MLTFFAVPHLQASMRHKDKCASGDPHHLEASRVILAVSEPDVNLVTIHLFRSWLSILPGRGSSRISAPLDQTVDHH
jgi:hypothetical protein